jgi:serine/threonine-protein kinase HipA
MTSEAGPDEAFVWIWLPGAVEPVVAGLLTRDGGRLLFNYGRSYLARADAIALYAPELPLEAGLQVPAPGQVLPGCIRDAAPDAWGRRVIINRRFGQSGKAIDVDRLDDLAYLMESGSDRIGALDFQRSATEFVPRETAPASLESLMTAADRVQSGVPLTPELAAALLHGSAIGGARPKAMILDHGTKYVAKFSVSSDIQDFVKGEYVAMRLAALAGLDAAPVRLLQTAGRDVLLVQRFDRARVGAGWTRKAMVSALTMLGLDEMTPHYASYEDLCGLIRRMFIQPKRTLHELFGRVVFNILVGNTDDHARNHAAFWDGTALALTPAYDICPQARAGNEATQAMLITGSDRMSRLETCRKGASSFQLSLAEADAVITAQVDVIRNRWREVCEEAGMSEVARNAMWRRQLLNPFAFEGLPPPLAGLAG